MSSSTGNVMEVDQQLLEYGGGGSSNPRRCAACKYLRRRCAPDCVLVPYFPASQPRRYADVHAVFGTSNATRLLQERGRAADTMAAEERRRVQDPVYGCTGVIDRLQQEIRAVQHELATTLAHLAMHAHRGAAPQQATAQLMMMSLLPPPPPHQPLAAAAAVVTVHAGTHGAVAAAVHEAADEDEEALLMDPDEFLDLDGRL